MPLVDPNKKTEGFNPNVDNANIAPKPNTAGKVITYLSFILIIPIFIFVSKRNTLVKLQMRINESASGIDVQLKKRRDTLVKLYDATKGEMSYEKSVLKDITKLRQNKTSNTNEEMELGDSISRAINVQVERYPDLKAHTAFTKLMNAAEEIEAEIAASRRLYNSYVNRFNTGIFTWPGSIVASGMNLSKLPLFAATESDKKDVELKFN